MQRVDGFDDAAQGVVGIAPIAGAAVLLGDEVAGRVWLC
jgi:hypothetical protein